MKILHICPDSWCSNCYLLIADGEAIVVDPSISVDTIVAGATNNNAVITGIVLTHCHFDHVISAEALHNITDAPVMIHEADGDGLSDPTLNAHKSFFGTDRSFRNADRLLHDGERIRLGKETIEVIHTPGHTRGGICLLTDNLLLTGDTLFANGFGRLDLPGGSLHDMKNSLIKLNTLDSTLRIYPGHGETASLADALSRLRFLRN